ncbi:pitrilysin family protein [Rurimicrobium arvi]|uniref:Pitrilysin family protein n=1 Tax=Rurimicrobium arvi TaxID=2049916 RepID=A0ABP8MHI5_9BACT
MTITDRKQAPAIHDAIEFDYRLPPLQTAVLDNGVPLYWLNAGVQDVVEINWVFPAGLWYEEKPAVAHASAGLLKSGTLQQTANQINESLEFYGANLKVHAGNDYITLTLDTLTRHLPAILPIVAEVMAEAQFPQHELDLYQNNAIQRLLVSQRECDFVANQKIDAMLFGADHPYGRYSRKEAIEALQCEDLLAFHRRHLGFSGLKMFMAGKVGDQEVQLLNRIFGSVAIQGTVSTPQHAIDAATERKVFFSNDPNGVQGAVRIGRRFIRRTHPDFAGVVVLNTVFGGYFGSRLMSNIREEKGFTYGIYSSVGAFAEDASLIIHTEAGRDVLEQTVTEVYHEMDRLCREPVEAEELLLVKNYLLGNILGDLDGPFSIMQRWRSLILNGFGIERFNANIETYKSITADELLTLAQRYLDKKDFYELVVV